MVHRHCRPLLAAPRRACPRVVRPAASPYLMDLPELLEPERIRCRCDIHSKKRALQTVAELLGESLRASAAKARAADGGDPDADETTPEISDMDILDALISRERLGSTGLGHGIALPHSRLEVVDAPLAALVTLNEGVDFESADGEPVDVVLGLLVPSDCNDEHLEILARLARRFSDVELRDRLRGASDGETLFGELQRLDTSS